MDSSLLESLPKLMGFGSLFAVLGGSLFSVFREVPGMLYSTFLNQLTVRVTIRDTDPLFPSVLNFFNKPSYIQRCKRFLAECVDARETWGYKASMDVKQFKSGISLTRAPGSHFIWYEQRMVFLERIVDDKKTGVDRPMESIIIRILGRNDAVLRKLMTTAKEEIESKHSEYLDLRISGKDGDWRHLQGCRKESYKVSSWLKTHSRM